MLHEKFKHEKFKVGARVTCLLTGRKGEVARQWKPWDQYRVRWEDGSVSSPWGKNLELQRED